jgi:hypothetical protein
VPGCCEAAAVTTRAGCAIGVATAAGATTCSACGGTRSGDAILATSAGDDALSSGPDVILSDGLSVGPGDSEFGWSLSRLDMSLLPIGFHQSVTTRAYQLVTFAGAGHRQE